MIPKQTKTEQKLSFAMFSVTIKRIAGLLITIAISSALANLMNKIVGILFVFFTVVIYLILTSKSPSHPKKPFWGGLLDFIFYFITKKSLFNTSSNDYFVSVKYKEDLLNAKNAKKKVKVKKKTKTTKEN